MRADLGGTDLLRPLQPVYRPPVQGSGVHQIFALTDGAVGNTDAVTEIARESSGHGANAGLIEGIADANSGRTDFVLLSGDLSKVVISQPALSLQWALRAST
jgi:hypothetical protein